MAKQSVSRPNARSRASRPVLSEITPDRYAALKACVDKLGYRLVRDIEGLRYILDPTRDELVAVQLDEKAIKVELAYLEGPDCAPNPAQRRAKVALEVRRAVKRVAKAYRHGGQDLTLEFDEALEELQKAVAA